MVISWRAISSSRAIAAMDVGCGGCRGGCELPRGGKVDQHRREQCGAVDAAVNAKKTASWLQDMIQLDRITL
jgi:hypothetical protein